MKARRSECERIQVTTMKETVQRQSRIIEVINMIESGWRDKKEELRLFIIPVNLLFEMGRFKFVN